MQITVGPGGCSAKTRRTLNILTRPRAGHSPLSQSPQHPFSLFNATTSTSTNTIHITTSTSTPSTISSYQLPTSDRMACLSNSHSQLPSLLIINQFKVTVIILKSGLVVPIESGVCELFCPIFFLDRFCMLMT